MNAMIWTSYGPPEVLQLQEVTKPTPKDQEVLIRISATTVTAGDCELRGLHVPLPLKLPLRLWLGVSKPRNPILGQELAGEVEAVGKEVTRFKPGDLVVGWTGLRLGTYAEYTCLPEDAVLFIKPTTMTPEEAATLPIGGLDALYFLQKGHLQSGHKVLINGAGGSMMNEN
jgi:NADPH:quinone reductase-like Zn-dependent oxidoreductase